MGSEVPTAITVPRRHKSVTTFFRGRVTLRGERIYKYKVKLFDININRREEARLQKVYGLLPFSKANIFIFFSLKNVARDDFMMKYVPRHSTSDMASGAKEWDEGR